MTGPAETTLGSETYLFSKDEQGRFVAQVHNLKHLAILTGLPAYEEVEDAPVVAVVSDEETAARIAELEEANGTLTKRVTELETENATLTSRASDLEGQIKLANDEVVELKGLLEAATEPDGSGGTSDTDEETAISPDSKVESLAGLGRASAKKLATKDIVTVAQLAALSAEQLAAIDAELELDGASERNQWLDQAKAVVAANSQA
jgi:predicted flap endonuclease-1-like 5' DNA nuclease